jgi:hypothetical protein
MILHAQVRYCQSIISIGVICSHWISLVSLLVSYATCLSFICVCTLHFVYICN